MRVLRGGAGGVTFNNFAPLFFEEIRGIGELLVTFMPQTTEKIQKQFAGPEIKSA